MTKQEKERAEWARAMFILTGNHEHQAEDIVPAVTRLVNMSLAQPHPIARSCIQCSKVIKGDIFKVCMTCVRRTT